MATVTITKPVQTTVKLVSPPPVKPWKPAPGRMGNLNEAQSKALETLKTQIKDEGWFVEDRMDDPMLLRCALPQPSQIVAPTNTGASDFSAHASSM